MDQVTTINRAETTSAEQNWRQDGGGRVLTFDMMLEMPRSRKIAGLGHQSEIVFEDRRYTVNHTEVVSKSSPEMVRLVLNRTSGPPKPRSAERRRLSWHVGSSWLGNAQPLPSHALSSAF